MSVFDVIDLVPHPDINEARLALEIGRRRYALRVARLALRGLSVLLGITIVVRLALNPAFRHRAASWQYIASAIGGTLAVSVFIGVVAAAGMWPTFRALIARERAGLPPVD